MRPDPRRAHQQPSESEGERDIGPGGDVTRLLERWTAGDAGALDELMPVVLGDLRRLAQSFMARERQTHTLQATALVNEVYLHLADRRTVVWKDRRQFFAFLGNVMRRILVDHSRSWRAAKRGGGMPLLHLDETLRLRDDRDPNLEALDDALNDLATIDARQSRIVEMRYFAGLSVVDIAHAEGVSATTIKREWRSARLWLIHHLQPSDRVGAA